jgi:hypothetical protein
MDGKVESHRVGKKYLIKNYEEVRWKNIWMIKKNGL